MYLFIFYIVSIFNSDSNNNSKIIPGKYKIFYDGSFVGNSLGIISVYNHNLMIVENNKMNDKSRYTEADLISLKDNKFLIKYSRGYLCVDKNEQKYYTKLCISEKNENTEWNIIKTDNDHFKIENDKFKLVFMKNNHELVKDLYLPEIYDFAKGMLMADDTKKLDNDEWYFLKIDSQKSTINQSKKDEDIVDNLEDTDTNKNSKKDINESINNKKTEFTKIDNFDLNKNTGLDFEFENDMDEEISSLNKDSESQESDELPTQEIEHTSSKIFTSKDELPDTEKNKSKSSDNIYQFNNMLNTNTSSHPNFYQKTKDIQGIFSDNFEKNNQFIANLKSMMNKNRGKDVNDNNKTSKIFNSTYLDILKNVLSKIRIDLATEKISNLFKKIHQIIPKNWKYFENPYPNISLKIILNDDKINCSDEKNCEFKKNDKNKKNLNYR